MDARGIAIVEDDDLVRASVSSLLRSLGLEVVGYASGETFLDEGPFRFRCIVSDMHMGGMSGLDLLTRIRACAVETPFILMTAFPSERLRERTHDAGGRFLEKPYDPDALIDALETAMGSLDID